MKIALTGAHGVGKTTLLNVLRDELGGPSEVAICREVPRVIVRAAGEDTFFRRGENTPLRQLLILFYQVIEEGLRSREADTVLADRTVIDHLAYTIVLFPEMVDSAEYTALLNAARLWLPEYDLIMKLPIEFAVVDDGVREADAEFQAQIDAAIDGIYAELGVRPMVISGSVEQRTASVLGHLRALRSGGRLA